MDSLSLTWDEAQALHTFLITHSGPVDQSSSYNTLGSVQVKLAALLGMTEEQQPELAMLNDAPSTLSTPVSAPTPESSSAATKPARKGWSSGSKKSQTKTKVISTEAPNPRRSRVKNSVDRRGGMALESRRLNDGEYLDSDEAMPHEPAASHVLDHVQTSSPILESQVLLCLPLQFFQGIATLCRDILRKPAHEASIVLDTINLIFHGLSGSGDHSNTQRVMSVNSPANLVRRCYMAKQGSNLCVFNYMISTMCLSIYVQRRQQMTQDSEEAILKQAAIQTPTGVLSSRTMRRYFGDGQRCIIMAGAGTMLLLALIACHEQSSGISFFKLTHDALMRISHLIRAPIEDEKGMQVIDYIIPAIALLRKQHRLKFGTYFEEGMLIPSGVRGELDISSDLSDSDRFFNSFLPNTMIPPRCHRVWAPCLIPVDNGDAFPIHLLQLSIFQSLPSTTNQPYTLITANPDRFPSPMSPLTALEDEEFPMDWENSQYPPVELVVINTPLDLSHPYNRAHLASSIEDAEEQLNSFLSAGYRHSPSDYVQITPEILTGRRLRINGKDGSFLAALLPDLPEDLRKNLLNAIKTTFFDQEVRHTSSCEKIENFSSLHFVWYNRYSLQGDNAEPGEHPVEYERRQQKNKKCGTPQTMPRISTETQHNLEEYTTLCDVLDPVFEWLYGAIKHVIPGEIQLIARLAEDLPGGGQSPALPFGGFVINFNVCTEVHRDEKDAGICVVLALTEDCTGGDLCLMEAGLRISLRCGDAIVFVSNGLSHFNIHYVGERVSIVFHTDGALAIWNSRRNGWLPSGFMIKGVSSPE
ncbi:hypothetical protein BJ165DRAFT_1531881 [Panaeolus papilionaceus]|nr:hypothetical protein BJ165DRAFT_1531881 [Panaeolus papilionaceus]